MTLAFGMFLLFQLSLAGQDFRKLAANEADKGKAKIAADFASGFFTTLKNNGIYPFKDEAIDAVKNQMTGENQKLIYEQLKAQFGDFQSLEYGETWIQGSNKAIQIVRFRGNFEKSNRSQEIRVVINGSNKIAGFWVKPWSDILK